MGVLHIIGGTPTNSANSLGTQNLINNPATTTPAGPPVTVETTGPVCSTITSMRTSAGPAIYLTPPFATPAPGPGVSPPGMGIPTTFNVLGNGMPMAVIKDQHMTIPGPGVGAASGTTGAPGLVVPAA